MVMERLRQLGQYAAYLRRHEEWWRKSRVNRLESTLYRSQYSGPWAEPARCTAVGGPGRFIRCPGMATRSDGLCAPCGTVYDRIVSSRRAAKSEAWNGRSGATA